MGDLNGRVGNNYQEAMGRFAGERTINDNGLCVANELLITNSLFNHKRIHQFTFESSQQQKSIIDYFLMQKQLRRFCRDVKVVRGAELSTDHHLLVADTLFVRGRRRKRRGFNRIKWEELKNEQKKEEYKTKLEEKLRETDTTITKQDVVEEKWTRIKTSILQACKEVCGEKKIKEGTKSSKWWTTEVQIEIKEKKKAWMKYKRTKDPRDMEDYKIKRNKCRKMVKEAKKKTWQEFGENLE